MLYLLSSNIYYEYLSEYQIVFVKKCGTNLIENSLTHSCGYLNIGFLECPYNQVLTSGDLFFLVFCA